LPDYPRLPNEEKRALLANIVGRCAHAPGAARSVVVFDLDGTLMDNRPRTCAILRDFAKRIEARNPAVAKRLLAVEPHELAYLIGDTLAKLGIDDEAIALDANAYWRERFFVDDHLTHDVEIPGAVDFARACYRAGAIIVYLTGRDLPLMGIGSFRSLRDLGFPIGVAGTELVLKPDAAMADDVFKRDAAPEIARVGRIIASFDNEPANTNIFLRLYPDAASVLIDTQHAPGAPPLDNGVRVIGDFRS
jgi:beta-phosphoglucomutase-like phosphatase (HAD superfamily)